MIKHPILGVALCLATCAETSHAQTAIDTPVRRTLDSTIAKAVTDAGIVGLATAVVVDGQIVWARAHGYADREAGVLLTTATVMNLASVSKTTIGVTMMRLVADGRLGLDQDINRYLPFTVINPHQPKVPITLRHLATHTSGIVDREDFYTSLYRKVGEPVMSLDALLRSYLVVGGANYSPDNFLKVAPGKSRDYSNLAATLAAYIVERAVGESFDAHTRRVIFEPLGMRSAGWNRTQVHGRPHSQLYVQDSASTTRVAPYDIVSYPDGGLQMSVEDLARYFAMLLNHGAQGRVRIIDSAALAEMQRFQWTAANKPENYELTEGNTGLFWRTKFNGERVGHGGNDPGVSVDMLTDAKGRVGIIMMSNTSPFGRANRHLQTVMDALTRFGDGIAIETGRR
ncbi:MAG: serine hydrolase domain-containing protein [Gemmatimonadota bacterium]